ncbi:hypothetical protein HanIR_Chr01g0027291 [Helianthus annuus]|nr:hypothetical protein HanIR_Chr01g0027291 [Helianthus annuus]
MRIPFDIGTAVLNRYQLGKVPHRLSIINSGKFLIKGVKFLVKKDMSIMYVSGIN